MLEIWTDKHTDKQTAGQTDIQLDTPVDIDARTHEKRRKKEQIFKNDKKWHLCHSKRTLD